MARYKDDYNGERRSVKVTLQLTPSERETLQNAAAKAGASLSQHARELCLRRSTSTPPVVAGTRRSADARALVNQLASIGNNLNQLTRLANTHQALPHHHELKTTTDLLKAALSYVIGN